MDLEILRQAEQSRFDSATTSAERNRLGQFATPRALAIEIMQYAYSLWEKRFDRARFLDPALGTGSFYSAFRQVFPAQAIEQAHGLEIDTDLAATANRLWRDTGLSVGAGDFTKQELTPAFNLVVTNPPYVRHHHMSQADKTRLKAVIANRLQIDISGLAGLYCYFLLLADAWLIDGGLALWLVPSEFMDVNYGSALKSYLTERVTLLRVHRYCPSDVQFGDALVTSAVVVFQKTPPARNHVVDMSFGRSLSAPMIRDRIPLALIRRVRKWSQLPQCKLTRGNADVTLGDHFTIRRGIATGANTFFIMNRQDAHREGIPSEFLRPILPGARSIYEDVIDANESGDPRLTTSLVLIDCRLPEEAIQQQFPRFWKYLEAGKQRGFHKRYLPSCRRPWYSQETRSPAPFLCTYMGRQRANGHAFRFFLNRSNAIAANTYLMLYPNGVLARALHERPEIGPVVLSILQGIKPDRLLAEGRVYGGGLHKLEPRELARLPADQLASAIRQRSLT